MKRNIHPQTHPVVFIDGEHQIVSRSTQKSDKTIDIDGVPHYVLNIEVSSYTHPLYTGEKRFLDTQGQVSKFKSRQEEAKKLKAKLAERRQKRVEKKQEQARSLRDLLGEL